MMPITYIENQFTLQRFCWQALDVGQSLFWTHSGLQPTYGSRKLMIIKLDLIMDT